MKLGFIGAGNMASALALGWNEPALVADIDRGKAEKLAAAISGTMAADNAELAEQADVVVLCHKPTQLEDVAASTKGKTKAVVSILAGVDVAALEAAYPDTPVYRFMPNLAAQVRRGTFCYVAGPRAADGPEEEILDLFGRLGTVVPLQESQMLIATAVMSCSPAWLALAAEAREQLRPLQHIPPGRRQAVKQQQRATAGAGVLDLEHDLSTLFGDATGSAGLRTRHTATRGFRR